MITLDTSGFWAVTNRSDPCHAAARGVLEDDVGPWFIPAVTLTEIAWLIAARSRRALAILTSVLTDIHSGQYALDCGENDLARISALLTRYEDLGLDLPDAAVVAAAERHGGRVLTTDRRHFDVVARGEGTLTVLPAAR
ncbi:MAG TPA: PIN domain-containing protein [Chloroflexota bacterium]|nr:PIN domain-containing protein [Chloroflexota bacterium]